MKVFLSTPPTLMLSDIKVGEIVVGAQDTNKGTVWTRVYLPKGDGTMLLELTKLGHQWNDQISQTQAVRRLLAGESITFTA